MLQCSYIMYLFISKEGEKISAGDVIAEIQTDKAVVALEADDDAVMAKIIKSEGSTGVQVRDSQCLKDIRSAVRIDWYSLH